MTHTETLEDGTETVKLIGKLLREKICIEGLFTTVLKTMVNDGKYYFITQNNGHDHTKSPLGMFESYAIDNDLAYVDAKIRSYYEIGTNFLTEEEMAEIDEEAKRVEIEPPKPRSERRRSRTAEPERKTRKSREEETDAKVVNAGMDEAGDAEEVEFDKVATPEVETPPRRRRRRTE
jgi:hypothetical protein